MLFFSLVGGCNKNKILITDVSSSLINLHFSNYK